MKFRPCIDIHNGSVKQIVGSSLQDAGDRASENFVASKDASWYAELFRRDALPGGHVIMLNGVSSPYYEATRAQALMALGAFPGGLQIGGGITAENASFFLDAGASHVIVTSYVFSNGRINWENLSMLEKEVGRERIVLDLSCRRLTGDASLSRPELSWDPYYICTDRWQKYTDTPLDAAFMASLSGHCAEFLVHGISVEGKGGGPDLSLVRLLGEYAAQEGAVPVTYAGGIRSPEDIRALGEAGGERVDYTVGSALDLYGGTLAYEMVTGTSVK